MTSPEISCELLSFIPVTTIDYKIRQEPRICSTKQSTPLQPGSLRAVVTVPEDRGTGRPGAEFGACKRPVSSNNRRSVPPPVRSITAWRNAYALPQAFGHAVIGRSGDPRKAFGHRVMTAQKPWQFGVKPCPTATAFHSMPLPPNGNDPGLNQLRLCIPSEEVGCGLRGEYCGASRSSEPINARTQVVCLRGRANFSWPVAD